MPNVLLARYFAGRVVFGEFNFAAMSETRHDDLFAAWLGAWLHAHGEQLAPEQSKLLEAENGQPGGRMDARTAQTAKLGNSALATLETVHRTQNAGR